MDESTALPTFRYHPDPLATGSVKAAPDMPCLGCNRIRGYIYSGPVYTAKNFILEDNLCPWCIADGTAAKKFSASFGYAGMMEDVPVEVTKEIEERTPGFTAWQQETWLACCNDAAAFLGLAGVKELKKDFPGAIPAVREHIEEDYGIENDELEEFYNGLSKDDQPTAYIFRCLHCRKYLAYVDQT
ncbi:MAG TPA: CbrC family protein [Bryobacteraceae bacterium]|nr:CbrC family protein [Bryobacteraceae bacterium]